MFSSPNPYVVEQPCFDRFQQCCSYIKIHGLNIAWLDGLEIPLSSNPDLIFLPDLFAVFLSPHGAACSLIFFNKFKKANTGQAGKYESSEGRILSRVNHFLFLSLLKHERC